MAQSTREVLRAELQRKLREVEALQLLLASEDEGEPANHTSVVSSNGNKREVLIVPGEFANMEKYKVAAIEKCLAKIGRAATIDELVTLLEQGGLKMYTNDPSRATRTARITVRMNSKARHPLVYDDKTDMVWLRAWDKGGATKDKRA